MQAQPKGALTTPAIAPASETIVPEHSVGNIVRRLLHHLREEYNNAKKNDGTVKPRSLTIANFVLQGQPRKQTAATKAVSNLVLKENDPEDPDSFAKTLKPVLMEAIQDILDELDTVYESVARSAKDHIHSEYVCLIPATLTIDTPLQ